MPKNLFQEIVFGIIMVIVMVFAMVCYNIAIAFGGLTNLVFVETLKSMWITVLIAFFVEMLFVGRIAKKIAFRVIDPEKNSPILLTITISAITVSFMCPIMSLVAMFIEVQPTASEFFATWIQTTILNFPMALCWQLFIAGPFVRFVFRLIFVYPKQKKQIND